MTATKEPSPIYAVDAPERIRPNKGLLGSKICVHSKSRWWNKLNNCPKIGIAIVNITSNTPLPIWATSPI